MLIRLYEGSLGRDIAEGYLDPVTKRKYDRFFNTMNSYTFKSKDFAQNKVPRLNLVEYNQPRNKVLYEKSRFCNSVEKESTNEYPENKDLPQPESIITGNIENPFYMKPRVFTNFSTRFPVLIGKPEEKRKSYDGYSFINKVPSDEKDKPENEQLNKFDIKKYENESNKHFLTQNISAPKFEIKVFTQQVNANRRCSSQGTVSCEEMKLEEVDNENETNRFVYKDIEATNNFKAFKNETKITNELQEETTSTQAVSKLKGIFSEEIERKIVLESSFNNDEADLQVSSDTDQLLDINKDIALIMGSNKIVNLDSV